MKKVFTFLFATIVAMSAFAQTNLAVDCATIATSGEAALAVDGNNGTRWESEKTDPQLWQVDLGEVKAFNTINIRWEGAYAQSFEIIGGNTVGADGYLTDGTVLTSVTGMTLGSNLVQSIALGDQSYRYVQFKGTERATQWGYSFFEFGVYNLSEALALSSMTLTAATGETPIGTPVALTLAGFDQLGGDIATGDVEYVLGTPAVGSVENGQFVPAATGTTTIKAVNGNVESNEVTITVIAGQKIDLFTDWNVRIYNLGLATSNSKVGAFDDNDGSNWDMLGKTTGADEASRTYDVGFIADLRGVYNLSSISIHFEGACSEAFTLAFAGEDGVFGEPTYSGGMPGINNHTETFGGAQGVRYVKFLSTKAATEWSVKIFDFSVFGTKVSDIADTEAPAISNITTDAAEESITLNITATDNSSKYLAYDVNGTIYAPSSMTGQTAAVVIDGLNGNTEYTFDVVAIDAFGNRSQTTQVTVKTTGEAFVLTVAPTPTVDAANVKSLYSNAYTPATTYNYGWWGQATAVNTETVDNDEMLKLTNYNYLGFEFAQDIDLSDMEYLHIDILPMQEMNFGITPIMRNAPTENSQSVGTLNVKQWNSIDIPLSQFVLNYTDNTAFQLKIDRGTGSEMVYVDNIYFYKEESGEEPIVDPNAQVLTADGHTISLVGYHYTGTDNYELIITSEETMTGLGGSFWNVNGVGGTDMRTNMTVSADGKTITVTATSTVAPQIYTPLYVMMPGEVNFGEVTINWIEKAGEEVEITAITIEADASEVEAGKTLQLTVKDQDGNVVTNGLSFASSAESIATIDENGLVTAIAEGTATITATYVAPQANGAPARAPGDAITAQFEVTVTAPAKPTEGQVLTADGHTITLVGYHYTGTNEYQLIITSEEAMNGLGGSFWHINGNEPTDVRTNMTVSDDGKTITITTTSTEDPQLYTPLYVLMPGEVNFGMVNIDWIEISDPTTGINGIANDVTGSNVVYSIDGRIMQNGGDRLMTLPAGIYVVNGKKVVVK